MPPALSGFRAALFCALIISRISEHRVMGATKSWKPLGGVPATLGMAAFPSLALDEQDGGRAYLAYSDLSGRGGGKAFVRRFAGGAWRQVGGNASMDGTQDVWLAMHPARKGYPWVAYSDNAADGGLSVVALEGGSWRYKGVPGFSLGFAAQVQLAISATGDVYVAFQDGWLDNRLTVMQFVGTWLYVGPDGPGITQQGVEYISLAVDKNGAPLVAFQDFSSPLLQGRLLIFSRTKPTGRSPPPPPAPPGFPGMPGRWLSVGSYFSAKQASYISLTTHPKTGQPYVAFTDEAHGHKVTVRTRAPKQPWKDVGPPGFAGPYSGTNSLAFDSAGTLHVAFQCKVAGTMKPCVRRLAGTSWVQEGQLGVSKGESALQDIHPYLTLRYHATAGFLAYSDRGYQGKAVVSAYS
ncbi:hypothetical protein ABPG77_005242 [Micractinium sp. CCAP 211/92]